MNSGFAGSASLDDRRRRRLLTEQNEDGLDCSAVVLSRGISESSRNHRYPVKRILPYKLWRLWMLIFLMTSLLGGMLYATWITSQRDLGPAMDMLFAESNGRIYPMMYVGLLFLSGQLCWLIGWARSRGPNDFRGQYRVWTPIGLAFYLISISVLLRVDQILEASILHSGLELPWDEADWNWLIPLAGLSLVLTWAINIEMRTSRIARAHFWLGVFALAAGLGIPYVPQIDVPELVRLGLTLGGLMLICHSLMWFGRQVLYFSADPAQKSRSLLGRLLGSLFVRKAETQTSEHEAPTESDKPKRQSKTRATPKKTPETKSTKPTRRRGRKKKTTTTTPTPPPIPAPEPEPVEEVIEQKELEKVESVPVEPVAEKPSMRLKAADFSVSSLDADVMQERLDMMELLAEEGEPFDQDLLKGLTKKQKKQIRSAWRDLERQYETRRAG